MDVFTPIVGFFLGLAVGSFLNVVIYRLHVKKSFFRGRSFCPHCRRTLHARHLIPLVSFLIQKRVCAFCKKKISWQYPAVELLMGALVVAFLLKDGVSWETLFALIMVSILVVLFVYDLRYMLVPDAVSLPGALIALIGSLLLGKSLFDLGLGGIIGAGIFLFQYVLSRGKWIGEGDIRIGLLMGFLLGWPTILIALGFAYVAGSVVGLLLILIRTRSWKSQIPFGTFLTASTVATLYWQEPLLAFWHDAFRL